MIADFECHFAIIDHSEQHALNHESYKSTTNHFIQSLHARVTPIFYIDKTEAEHDTGMTKSMVDKRSWVW
jgi:Triosephosphate isomerase